MFFWLQCRMGNEKARSWRKSGALIELQRIKKIDSYLSTRSRARRNTILAKVGEALISRRCRRMRGWAVGWSEAQGAAAGYCWATRAMEHHHGAKNGTGGTSADPEDDYVNIHFVIGERAEVASFRPDQLTNSEIKGTLILQHFLIPYFFMIMYII